MGRLRRQAALLPCRCHSAAEKATFGHQDYHELLISPNFSPPLNPPVAPIPLCSSNAFPRRFGTRKAVPNALPQSDTTLYPYILCNITELEDYGLHWE